MDFAGSKLTLDYTDVLSAVVWDTARDNDAGLWRELWRASGVANEARKPTVKTGAPSTMYVVARTGAVELIDATEPVQFEQPHYGPQFLRIWGPLAVDAVTHAHAAEGMIAVRAGNNLYMFDLYTRTVYKMTTAGLFLCKPPNNETWGERWPSEVLAQIGTAALTANASGRVRCSRAVTMFAKPVDRPTHRPYIFVESGAVVSALTPDQRSVQWTASGWAGVYDLDVLPRGEIIFRGGATDNGSKAILLRPDNWLWPSGSTTVTTAGQGSVIFGANNEVVVPDGSKIGPGNNEVGLRLRSSGVDTGVTLVADLDTALGGQRIISEGSFGPKVPGIAMAMVCGGAADPEDDILAGSADFTRTGSLTASVVKGRTFWAGWATGNYLAADYAGATIPLATGGFLTDRWAISGEIIRTGTCDNDVVLEFAHAPSGYSGDAFKLFIESDVLKFVASQDGYSTAEVTLVPMTGALPLNRAVPFTLGFDNGIFYLIADGRRVSASGTQISNTSATLRIGVGVNGSAPIDNAKISSFTFGKNGRLKAADRAAAENLSTMVELNDATIEGEYFQLIGGDDEFDSYSLITEENLYKIQNGEIIAKTGIRNMDLADTVVSDVTNIIGNVRGWRSAYSFTWDSKNWARFQNAPITFDRSEYEKFLTRLPRKPKNDIEMEFITGAAVNKTGPRLTVQPRRQEIFEIDAIAVQNNGLIRRFKGTLILRRLESGDAVATIVVAGEGNTIASTEITFTATADGGYLTFVASSNPLDWSMKINRIAA